MSPGTPDFSSLELMGHCFLPLNPLYEYLDLGFPSSGYPGARALPLALHTSLCFCNSFLGALGMQRDSSQLSLFHKKHVFVLAAPVGFDPQSPFPPTHHQFHY